MQPDKTDTRQKIIEKAMKIIGQECRMNVTIREIANEAGVNLASINYYFRSKEKLIEEVEDFFCQNIQKITDILDEQTTSLVDKIENWAKKLMHYLAEYPGVMFLWALYVLNCQPGDSKISQIIQLSEIKLGKLMAELNPKLDKETIGFQVTQILAGIINPVILYKVAGGNLDISIENPELRDRYIHFLFQHLQD
jgi:AcrR family transcriptional regulator